MSGKYSSEIDRLKKLEAEESKLKGAISNCDDFIRLLRVKPTKDVITVGKPRIEIEVSDDYRDGDWWTSAKLIFERDKLSQSIIDSLIKLAEDRKNELTVELNNLPS
jgi:hypothetical protein